MLQYIEVCKGAGVGPSALITKVDRMVTGLTFLKLNLTRPGDAPRLAEVDRTITRMSQWRASWRKEKNTKRALARSEDLEEDRDVSTFAEVNHVKPLTQSSITPIYLGPQLYRDVQRV